MTDRSLCDMVAPDANQTAVAVDASSSTIEKKTLAEVSAFTAQPWFDKTDDLPPSSNDRARIFVGVDPRPAVGINQNSSNCSRR